MAVGDEKGCMRGLSLENWSYLKSVRGTIFTDNFGPPRPVFHEKLVPLWNFGPPPLRVFNGSVIL